MMARMDPDDGAVAIRPAATIVVARPGGSGRAGVEVLVLRRSRSSRFVPGFIVFPGGAVDVEDEALATRWFGSPAERTRACAIRELAEEAGLVLSRSGIERAAAGWLEPARFLPAAVDQLPRIGRWIAPDFLPVRFDASFFAARCRRGVEPFVDGREVDAAWWAEPSDVLAGQQAGEFPLAWPTMKTLEALAGCTSVEGVLALRVEQVTPPMPRPAAAL
jgi:8-oxo-dGTP pyrophosphatase MutT (NUDIX family)